MIGRRALLITLAVAALGAAPAGPVFAQAAPGDAAVAVVKTIYATPAGPKKQPFSKRLAGLFAAAVKKSRELDEPVSGLDFDYRINGQDHEDDTFKSVRYAVVSADAARAEVKVTFKNGGPQTLTYLMVNEGGKWLVDDVRGKVENDPWSLAELYALGAKGN